VNQKIKAYRNSQKEERMKDLRHNISVCFHCSDASAFCCSELKTGIESSKYVIHSPHEGYSGRRFIPSEGDFPQEME
jgi:hypothetical protein